jgi:hypothetical protein
MSKKRKPPKQPVAQKAPPRMKGPAESTVRQVRAQKAGFDVAHARRGMKGLAEGDYEALGEAIRDERAVIEEFTPVVPRGKQQTPARSKPEGK